MIRIFANCVFKQSLDGVVNNSRYDYSVMGRQPADVNIVIQENVYYHFY